MNKELEETIEKLEFRALEGREEYQKDYIIKLFSIIKKAITNQQSKLDKIEEIINDNTPMSYRLAMIKDLLKKETNNE